MSNPKIKIFSLTTWVYDIRALGGYRQIKDPFNVEAVDGFQAAKLLAGWMGWEDSDWQNTTANQGKPHFIIHQGKPHFIIRNETPEGDL